MDMRFGTWNTVLRELSKYKLELVGVQEVRWEGSGTEPSGEYTFSTEMGMRVMKSHELGTGYFVHKRIISAVKRVQFVSDRTSYIILRGPWFHIIVLNVHVPTEDKTDDMKDSLYEEFECVCLINFLHTI
jgi:hypothetical protein